MTGARKRRRRSWAWRHRRSLWLGGLLAFAGASGAIYLIARVPLPPAGALAETTILSDVNGARLASIDSGEDRIPVALSAVPVTVITAVLATEDRNFFQHGGIDPLGVTRAAIADVRGRPLQGGSTITQQYVKQVYLTRERSLARKIREAALALKLERTLRKEEILERYLNTVYFGRGAYGVQAASRAYFNKDVQELRLSEAAYLAGLIRAPEAADADRHREAATARRNRTLLAMREEGWIDGSQERRARAEPIETVVLSRTEREPDIVGADKGTQYFVEYVRAELVRRYGEDTTYQGGLRVKTSLDLNLQTLAYDAIYGLLDQPKSDPAGALVSIDGEGRIVAMVGGRNFVESKVNYAVGTQGGGSGRQAGSTFKPFLLAAAVKSGFSVQSAFPAPAQVVLPKADRGKDYPIDNYDDVGFAAPRNLIDATAESINTVYVQAQEALGRDKAVDMAKQLGVRTSPIGAHPSTVLGTAEVSMVEMASAYSTFAARGVYVPPRAILEVRRADGTLIESEAPPKPERILTTEEADVVNHCLRQVVLRGTGTGAKLSSVQVAGKTGTAQNYADAWFVGFTPKLTTAVWMGYPDEARPMRSVRGVENVTGGSFPAMIFRRFMQEATRDPRFQAVFPRVSRFKGKPLEPPDDVILATTTTEAPTEPTTTTVPPAAPAVPAPVPAPPPATAPSG